jgi:phosphoribosylamine--glycine ligase
LLVIGGGGREHALAYSLNQSPLTGEITAAPGNAGMASIGSLANVDISDVNAVTAFARQTKQDLVVVGPEAPLADGLVDALTAENIKAFGPGRAAARIESSKVFAKEFMKRHGIPTADFKIFNKAEDALSYLEVIDYPTVVKADGLAAGKGAIVCMDKQQAEDAVRLVMIERKFGDAGDRLIIESFLDGEEVSVIVVTDGIDYSSSLPSQDHKRALDGDKGPNTGGMGAYAPAPLVTAEMETTINRRIIEPTLEGFKRDGIEYKGVLYAGLMIEADGPKVMEYNCRFGDPETQAVLPLLETDLVEVILAVVDGRLKEVDLTWKNGAALSVVMASAGYPGSYQTGYPIDGLQEAAALPWARVYHAGTELKDGKVVTAGGRVLNLTAIGPDLSQAFDRAYKLTEIVSFKDARFRKDIGHRALSQLVGSQ